MIHQTQALSASEVTMSIVCKTELQFIDCVLCVSASSKCALLEFLLYTVCPLD